MWAREWKEEGEKYKQWKQLTSLDLVLFCIPGFENERIRGSSWSWKLPKTFFVFYWCGFLIPTDLDSNSNPNYIIERKQAYFCNPVVPSRFDSFQLYILIKKWIKMLIGDNSMFQLVCNIIRRHDLISNKDNLILKKNI